MDEVAPATVARVTPAAEADRAVPARADPVGGRLWEIDCARTVAIAMMISYHVVYDFDFLGAPFGPDPFAGWWGALPEATASSFLFIVGVALWVTDARGRVRSPKRWARWRRHAVRSGRVMSAALLVTVVTFLLLPDRYVRFGILHAIAVSTLLAVPLLRIGLWNSAIGVGVIAVGVAVPEVDTDVPGGFVIVRPEQFATVDYWPLLPWFGVVLLGVAAGSVLYPGGQRRPVMSALAISDGRRLAAVNILAAPGRRSLWVYLVHQPVLIAVLALGLIIGGVDVDWR